MGGIGCGPLPATPNSDEIVMAEAHNIRRCEACGGRLARDNRSSMCGPCSSSGSTHALQGQELPADFWEAPTLQRALASRHIGQVIRAFRQHDHFGRRDLSQDEVADWAGITQGQLSRIETGQAVQDLDRLTFWAQLLNIPEQYLWFKLPQSKQRVEDPQPTAAELLPHSPRARHDQRTEGFAGDEEDDDPLAAERTAALGPDLWELHDVLQP